MYALCVELRYLACRPRVLSRAFGCGGHKDPVGALRHTSGSPAEVRGTRCGRSESREEKAFFKGLIPASLSRAGPMETSFVLCVYAVLLCCCVTRSSKPCTCGRHGTTAAALQGLPLVTATDNAYVLCVRVRGASGVCALS